jgi:hypothetical protein
MPHELRAASIAWSRELIRFRTGRLHAITTLVPAIVFLFRAWHRVIFAGRMQHAAGCHLRDLYLSGRPGDAGTVNVTISRPCQSRGTGSFDSFREILVAPVSRAVIVIGKWPGGATIATFQALRSCSRPTAGIVAITSAGMMAVALAGFRQAG